MKAYVITLRNHAYSERKAAVCIESAAEHGLTVERWDAIGPDTAEDEMQACGLRWTWAEGNTRTVRCPQTGLWQHPYGTLRQKIGCFLSHYTLWRWCSKVAEPILILEHDARFLRPLPEIEFNGICQINCPEGATPHGAKWANMMCQRGPGVWPKTRILPDGWPDGLAGNSAYLIKPWAAQDLIAAAHRYGIWPNDALMCVQLFPYLQEVYPWVTLTEQEQSTTSVKE